MKLIFESGSEENPVGHALIYFTASNSERVLATYVVVPPIALNIGKYMPPMFAASLPLDGLDATRPVPLPPIPEEVPDVTHLQRLATARADDLVFAGAVYDSDPQRLLLETGYACEAYGNLCKSAITSPAVSTIEPKMVELDTISIVYSAMDEGQRLSELTKLVGSVRDAVENGSPHDSDTNLALMRSLVATLPAKYHGSQLVDAVNELGERGRHRCQLLLERAFALQREDYLNIGRLDSDIAGLA